MKKIAMEALLTAALTISFLLNGVAVSGPQSLGDCQTNPDGSCTDLYCSTRSGYSCYYEFVWPNGGACECTAALSPTGR